MNWHTTDTGNGMPVHRAFDVMAPIDVHSARCLAIQPGRAASSPPRAGRNFFGAAENVENYINQRRLGSAPDTERDVSRQNNSETRRAETGKIRGICSPIVPTDQDRLEIDQRLFGAHQNAGRSALGMPSSVDTFMVTFEQPGLALVLPNPSGRQIIECNARTGEGVVQLEEIETC